MKMLPVALTIRQPLPSLPTICPLELKTNARRWPIFAGTHAHGRTVRYLSGLYTLFHSSVLMNTLMPTTLIVLQV